MRWYLDWIRDQLVELTVDIRLNHAPTVAELGGFDVVLNATGARSYVPEVSGDTSRVVPFEDTMSCPKVACECYPGGRKLHKLGQHVLLWGDSYAATDTAAFLANIGKKVTIVTENPEFAADCEVIHMYVLRKRFAQGDAEVLTSRPYPHPVTVLTSTTVVETRPDVDLLDELRATGVHVLNVGDSVRPRNLYHAVKEGSAFGYEVDENLLFNANGAIVNDLPIDILAQLKREPGPSYSTRQMLALAEGLGSAEHR